MTSSRHLVREEVKKRTHTFVAIGCISTFCFLFLSLACVAGISDIFHEKNCQILVTRLH